MKARMDIAEQQAAPNVGSASTNTPSGASGLSFIVHRSSFIILTLIVVVAIALRVIGLGDVPPPFFRDEAEKGYNAWCLWKTGADYEGRRLPLFINVFGAYTSAIYQYATAPLVGIFGLKVWTVRLTAALVGIATVVFLYLLARALLDLPTALVAAAVLAISPWHVHFSRWAQQGIFMPLLFTLAAWGTVRFRQGWRAGLPIAAAAIGLSAYAYDVGRVLAPLFLLLLVAVARRDLRQCKVWAIVSALVLAIFVAPTLWFVIHQPDEALARFRRISIAQPGMLPAQVVGQFVVNYAKHFDPIYLAFRGDREPRHSIGKTGEIYPLELPFLLLGIYFLARRRNAACGELGRAAAAMIIGWIAIAPVASSMTNVGIPHALRSLAAVPAFALAIAVGLVESVRLVPDKAGKISIISLLVFAELILMGCSAFYYFKIYPSTSVEVWQCGFKEALDCCRKEHWPGPDSSRVEPEIWITESVGGLALPPEMISPLEIFVAFYWPIPPREFQKNRLGGIPLRIVRWGTNINDLLTQPNRPPIFAIVRAGEIRKEIANQIDLRRYFLPLREGWPISSYYLFPIPALDRK